MVVAAPVLGQAVGQLLATLEKKGCGCLLAAMEVACGGAMADSSNGGCGLEVAWADSVRKGGDLGWAAVCERRKGRKQEQPLLLIFLFPRKFPPARASSSSLLTLCPPP